MFIRMIGTVVASAALLVGVGCGGKEAEVAKTAFSTEIDRATVDLDISANAAGQSVKVTLDGPYSSNGKDTLPSVDWKLHAEGVGPAPVDARVISSATNAFVEYGGETYEVGEDKVAQLRQHQGGSQGPSPADLQAFLEKAKGWFPDTATQEDAELDGEDVNRITGKLDLSKAFADIMDMAAKQGHMPGPAIGIDPKQFEQFLSDPRFTLDTAKSDGTLRRIAATAQLEGVPGGGEISFSLQLRDVGEQVVITPPASGRPIEELAEKLKQQFGAMAPAFS
jgi:hypothetical protein